MIRLAPLFSLSLALLAGCSSVPEVAMRESAAVQTAGYPALAPLPQLIAAAEAPSRATSAEAELAARAARLRARASGLRQLPSG